MFTDTPQAFHTPWHIMELNKYLLTMWMCKEHGTVWRTGNSPARRVENVTTFRATSIKIIRMQQQSLVGVTGDIIARRIFRRSVSDLPSSILPLEVGSLRNIFKVSVRVMFLVSKSIRHCFSRGCQNRKLETKPWRGHVAKTWPLFTDAKEKHGDRFGWSTKE